MLRAILNKSWRQHPTKQQLYGDLPPIMKTIQVRRTRHAGDCWRSRDELISDILLWTPSHGRAKADDQLEPIYISLPIQDIALKISWDQQTMETGGERGSGRSLLAAQRDDYEAKPSDDLVSYRRQTLMGGVLPLCRGAVKVFYCPTGPGNKNKYYCKFAILYFLY